MSAPSAAAVSRFLGSRFRRSKRVGPGPDGITHGFTVHRALGYGIREADWVTVEFEPGYHLQSRLSGHPDLLLKNTQKVLVEFERELKTRYDVSRNDGDGEDQWNCLLVRNRKTEQEKN